MLVSRAPITSSTPPGAPANYTLGSYPWVRLVLWPRCSHPSASIWSACAGLIVTRRLPDGTAFPPSAQHVVESTPLICASTPFLCSPFFLEVKEDANKELIQPAVEGTLNVLRSAARSKDSLKRIVVTSSVASAQSAL